MLYCRHRPIISHPVQTFSIGLHVVCQEQQTCSSRVYIYIYDLHEIIIKLPSFDVVLELNLNLVLSFPVGLFEA